MVVAGWWDIMVVGMMRMMVVVFMVVLNLLLMLLMVLLVLLVMVGRHVLVVTSLGRHVTPMIPLVMHIVVLEPRGRGSHGGGPTNAHNNALGMAILARAREYYTVTRVRVLGGGVGLVMTHSASTVAAMSVSHRGGRGEPALRGGHSHGDTSHLLSCLGQANQWSYPLVGLS